MTHYDFRCMKCDSVITAEERPDVCPHCFGDAETKEYTFYTDKELSQMIEDFLHDRSVCKNILDYADAIYWTRISVITGKQDPNTFNAMLKLAEQAIDMEIGELKKMRQNLRQKIIAQGKRLEE